MLNILIRVACFLCFAFAPLGAIAHEVETGQGVICDTAAQVERFAWSTNGPAEMAAINAESKNACAIVNVAFIRGAEVSQLRTRDATYAIVVILVLGVVTEDGIAPVEPTRQFTLMSVDEKGA